MGTRNLVAVYLDGAHRIAQYGQWDGYPSGQGATVLKFLTETLSERNFLSSEKKIDPAKLEAFKTKLRAARFVEQQELEDLWVDAGAERGAQFVSCTIADKFGYLYPALSRDAGGEILNLVFKNEPGIRLKDSLSFAADGLFCEYAYVIDLDANTFEVYFGFNKGNGGRFADMKNPDDTSHRTEKYAPVGLMKTYNLDALPTEEQFIADLKQPDEEE